MSEDKGFNSGRLSEEIQEKSDKLTTSRRKFLAAFLIGATSLLAEGGEEVLVKKFKETISPIKKIQARRVNKTCAEIYKIQPYYKRFDPRLQAFYRSGDPTALCYKWVETHMKTVPSHIKRGDRGFTWRDYALVHGAMTVQWASGSGYGNRNKGFYSWKPIEEMWASPGYPFVPLFIPKGEKFKATSEENSKMVKKAAKMLGASLVGICMLDKRWAYSHTPDGRPIEFEDVEEAYETKSKVVIPESHKYVVVMAVEEKRRYTVDMLQQPLNLQKL